VYKPEGSGDEDQVLFDDLKARFVTFQPPLLYAGIVDGNDSWGRLPEHRLSDHFGRATAVFVEGPLLTMPPTFDSSAVNLGMLTVGLGDSAPARDFVSREVVGSVDLCNVFIELAVLDAVGWERVDREREPFEVTRAIWLVRDKDRFFMTWFVERFPEGGYMAGPIEIAHDPRKQVFAMRRPSWRAKWMQLVDQPSVARRFFKALALVRSLSPAWKVSPFAQAEIESEGEFSSLTQVEWALGDVVSLAALNGPIRRYHALRHWGNDEVFFGHAPPWSPALAEVIRLEGRYAQFHPDEILAAVGKELAELGSRPPSRVPSTAQD